MNEQLRVMSSYEQNGYFYCATCMHSADYAMARCLSVRPSDASIVSKRLHISSKFFHRLVLVFPYQMGWQYSDGNPLNGGVECKGV